MSDERRTHHRYAIWFPVTIVRGTERILGICRDASAGGVLVSAAAPVAVGEKVVLQLRIALDDPEYELEATVLRVADNDDELLLAFPFRIGFEFRSQGPIFPEALRRRTDPPKA